MRRIAKRSVFLWVLIAAFFAGLIFLSVSLVTNAGDWVMKSSNRHIYTSGQLIGAGEIHDVNGKVLAQTVDGKRVYNDDSTVRKATLHAVGDPQRFIATGIQSVCDTDLTGYNFINGVYNIKKYGKGNNLTMTLDADVCATAYKQLNGRKGTIGVYNYKTGEILCMVSTPSYDVNSIPTDIETNPKYEGAYVNRLISGRYAPGSTFKTIVSISAIDNISDIYDRTWECKGSYTASDGGKIICNATHGKIDFKTALAQSCNSAFAQIAIELGAQKLTKTVEQLGLTTPITIDGMTVGKGTFTVSDDVPSELGWAGIGQSTTMLAPIQMMKAMGAVANNGQCVDMTLIKEIKSPSGLPVSLSFMTKAKTQTIVNPDTAAKLKDMMRNDVLTVYGENNYKGLNLCAKSGTAQINGKTSTAWFTGFLDSEENPYAFVVVIEEGGAGSKVAGPVAGKVLQSIVNKQ